MPHRPPRHPLPHGVTWRKLALGEGRAGQPLGEWAYITPGHPDGLREGDLSAAEPDEQVITAQVWFLSNYRPSTAEGLGHGTAAHGVPPTPFWTPDTILLEEFAGLIPAGVLSDLSSSLQAQADFWCLHPAPRQIELQEQGGPASLLAAAEEALSRAEEALRAVAALRGSMGHNQGPSVPDVHTEAAVVQAIKDARAGLSEGAGGVPVVEKARLTLRDVADLVGRGLLTGLGKKAGEDAYGPAKGLLLDLFHYLIRASVTLGCWILGGQP